MSSTMSFELDKLFEHTRNFRDFLDTTSLFDVLIRFRHIAPFNAALIAIQKPGSVYVASAEEWEKRFNRHVKPNAQPIMILKPFAPVTWVFDYSDTEGVPLPNEFFNHIVSEEKVDEIMLANFVHSLNLNGFRYDERAFGSAMYGELKALNTPEVFTIPPKSPQGKMKVVTAYFGIVVNLNLTPTEKFAVILHELAHFYCGHVVDEKFSGVPHRSYLTNEQQEFEAESTAYLVCKRMGIQCNSATYLSGYLNKEKEIPEISRDVIIRAVKKIEDMIK